MIKYEDLILKPYKVALKVKELLNIDFNIGMIYPEDHIQILQPQPPQHAIDNVKKPYFLDSLCAWTTRIPEVYTHGKKSRHHLLKLAPMMEELGYDKFENLDDCKKLYGEADPMIKSRLDGPKFKNIFKREWRN